MCRAWQKAGNDQPAEGLVGTARNLWGPCILGKEYDVTSSYTHSNLKADQKHWLICPIHCCGLLCQYKLHAKPAAVASAVLQSQSLHAVRKCWSSRNASSFLWLSTSASNWV